MFASNPSPSDSYKQVGVETGVMAASPHQLILMLFDGALLSLSVAREAMAQKDIAAKGKAISKTIEILTNGLKASLDFEQGGELAERLAALCAELGPSAIAHAADVAVEEPALTAVAFAESRCGKP
ncbi:MAG: flagellar export chaperone FliS, partial [Rhodocyclaceae bacterium]|nr:flagellar export chaperone FliS [Rhodocyclaceae bacterium]